MLCRCKYSTSLILILIVSTPDVSCKHFVSHGLSIEPLVLLHLYLQMPHPGNVVQEEFSSAEEEPHEASASVWFSSTAFLSRFCISAIFFFKVCPNKFYIYVKTLIWKTPSKQRASSPAYACRGPHRVDATACVHALVVAGRNQGVVGHTWSQQPLLGPSLPWGLSPCPVLMLQSFVLVFALQL